MRNAALGLLALLACATSPAAAQVPENGGRYNARFLQGGVGIERDLRDADALVRAGAACSISSWVWPDSVRDGHAMLIAIDDPTTPNCCA
ncbi:hypothetical protein [Sphingomonas sp.]|uniref:hypothetical protein n=1 Tax=Sphingomonas sp. TaxID=28214 RepID=UPI001B1F81F4|nr:hypothetical protein [Sphingomonas sp.]MBO9712250.1 hypothetical protein [Sphingomonas sp.]